MLAQEIPCTCDEVWAKYDRADPTCAWHSGGGMEAAAALDAAGLLAPEPRVWHAGDPEPDGDVQCVITDEGELHPRSGERWVMEDGSLVRWSTLQSWADWGPGTLTEVRLPTPAGDPR